MTSPRRLPLAVVLLAWLLPGHDPLVGDLLEASAGRSPLWLWRQVLLAAPARLLFAIRMDPRTSIANALVSTAMLALLGFSAVVLATLAAHVVVLTDAGWMPMTGGFRDWQWHATVPVFAGAIAIGRLIARFHHDHRVAAVVVCGLSATAAATVNLLLFVPDVLLQPLVPSAATQIAVSMVFVGGLFAGIASRSECEALPS